MVELVTSTSDDDDEEDDEGVGEEESGVKELDELSTTCELDERELDVGVDDSTAEEVGPDDGSTTLLLPLPLWLPLPVPLVSVLLSWRSISRAWCRL